MVEKQDHYFKSHDHHRLYYESYRPNRSKAVLIFVHGLNEHVGRYKHVVQYFKNIYSIYLFDHRGHGRSDGIRSHVEDFNHYINDLNEFVNIVASKEKNKKIFLIAHSMGGQIAVNYVAKFPKAPIAGLITSSPNLRIKVKISNLKKYFGTMLAEHMPKFKVPNDIDPKWISRDREVVLAYKRDPLISKTISVKLASEILANLETIMELAPKITVPALMMHGGDDHICDKQGTADFFEKMGSKDKKIKIYDDMYHEIFNEIGKEEVLEDMAAWLKKRV